MLTALLAITTLAAPLADTRARDEAIDALVRASPEARFLPARHGEIGLALDLSVAPREVDAELAARTFLSEHGAAFGVRDSDVLVLRKGLLAGESGPLVFERTVNGLTVFGGHVTVGIGARGEITSASSIGALPAIVSDFRVDEQAARRAALASFPGDVAWVAKGYSVADDGLHATYLAAVVQQKPYKSFRVSVDGNTGRAGLAMPMLRYANQAKLYRISPSKPYATTVPPAACNITTDSKGNKKYDTCAPAEMVTLQGLKGDGTLSGNPVQHQGRTSVYNCKGGTTYSTTACTQTFKADGNGDFIPSNLTDYTTSTTDQMSELQAYYFVDIHSRFMDSLDPSFVGLPLIPGFPNAYTSGGAGLIGGGGASALDNAFFDPANKIMVFGQGSSVDFAYDGEVVFHEMTHAACGAIGDTIHAPDVLFPVAHAGGLLVDPLAINEGNADTFSFMEPGVNDPYLAEFDARDEISLLGQTIPVGPAGYIRDEGPDFLKTCQGDGNATNPGRSGEAHDDGEVWAEFTYEAFQGLKPIPVPSGATYQSVASPTMFKALQQLIALPSEQQTFSVYASLFEGQVRNAYGNAAGDYVHCVAQRHAIPDCDGQLVTVYSGEKPFNDTYVQNAWKAF
ncbi:MAG: hypothetical protein JST92_19080 [Deltaproteobacteria bacterium]|nr:hypothetical protein [Deltaproteobacteria bacterium]